MHVINSKVEQYCSCGDEEVNENTIANNNPISSEENFRTVISSKISATVYYRDFFWHISINTSLQNSDVNYNSIKYGIKCGYTNYPAKEYTKYFTAGGSIITSKVPLFIDTPYANQAFYTNSYVELNQKMANGQKLSDDEQGFYNYLLQDMQKNESSAKSAYWGKVFVEVGDEIFYVKTF